jgi:hypothetical protein
MKFRTIVCASLTLAALGMALLVPHSVRAQRDMAPAASEISPSAPAGMAPAAQTASSPGPATTAKAEAAAVLPKTTNAGVTPAAETAGMTPLDAIMIIALIVCNGLIILLGVTLALRRGRRHFRGASAPYASAYRAL